MVTQIKTMQAKYLIDEKSELQTQLQDRDQRLKIISVENSQVATTTALIMYYISIISSRAIDFCIPICIITTVALTSVLLLSSYDTV